MTVPLRVILELGKARRVVAGAMDWPGLDRWGRSEEDALDKLVAYRPRYAPVAERAGLGADLERARTIEVVERVPGSSSTDFWGIAHVPSHVEREVLASAELERRLGLLRACWATFDEAAARAAEDLLPGPRSAGRTRDQIIRHVYANEPEQFSRKVEVRTPREVVLTPGGLAAHREAFLDAVRAWNAEGRAARTWPIQFLVRRTAHHVMDHAWELQDRDPGGSGVTRTALADPGLRAVIDGWRASQEQLVTCLRPLTTDQLALRGSPDHWAVWQLASNIAGGRAFWFHDILGEGEASIRDRFRVATTTVPGLPLEDAGWEDDETHPRSAAELVDALEATRRLIDGCLNRWIADDLLAEFVRGEGPHRRVVSRAWVVWHIVEHDLQHGTEIALILREHGLPTLDI